MHFCFNAASSAASDNDSGKTLLRSGANMGCGLTEAELTLRTHARFALINAWNWKDNVKYERRSLENLPALPVELEVMS